jgi:hypothetical protein
MAQKERLQWGHFVLRVRQGPAGMQWQIEDLESGEIRSYSAPHEVLAFIQAHLVEKIQDAPAAHETELL